MLKERLKKLLSILMVVGVLTGGLFFVSGEEASAKQVIRSVDYEQNKLTGNRGSAFNYVYFTVPDSAYLNQQASTKIKTGIIYDTYREYWIYYSSTYNKYYP